MAKRLKNNPSMIHHLPKDIIFNIFSRLPIQSICRIRFVCKEWFGFINDPAFMNSSIFPTDSTFIIFSTCTPKFYLINLDENLVCFLPKEPSKTVKLISSVNGLVCLRYTNSTDYLFMRNDTPSEDGCFRETIHIWNPITRDVYKLPPSPSNAKKENFCSEIAASGFALDSTTNKFKVVHSWILTNLVGENKVGIMEIGIYTLGVRKWRMIQDIPTSFRFIENTSQVFLNGALHFRISSSNPEYNNCIGFIDIATETFRAFKGPSDTDSIYSSLYVLEDRLCVSVYSVNCHNITLWTMNDYGVTETWTARYVIAGGFLEFLFEKDVFNWSLQGVRLKILNTRMNGVVLFVGGVAQGYYELEKKKFQQLQISGIWDRIELHEQGADVHVCSLISPRALARARVRKTGTAKTSLHSRKKAELQLMKS